MSRGDVSEPGRSGKFEATAKGGVLLVNGTETERLVRIEEQVIGVREDIGEMKTSVKTATDIMSQLHVNFVPRTEIEKQIEIRERAENEQNKQINALWKKVDHLDKWRSWLTGAIGVIVSLAVLLFEFGKQWFGGVAH